MTRIDTTCVTHSYACDCREAKFSALEAENTALKARVEKLRGALEWYAYAHWKTGRHLLCDAGVKAKEALEADKPSS